MLNHERHVGNGQQVTIRGYEPRLFKKVLAVITRGSHIELSERRTMVYLGPGQALQQEVGEGLLLTGMLHSSAKPED